MKKIIQIVSFLALIFVMAGSEAFAQSVTKIDANIPYDFTVGDQQFDAGKYVMRVKRMPNGASTIVELRDSKYRVIYEGFAMENGSTGGGKANLVFDKSGSVARLTHVRTGSKGFTITDDGSTDRTVNLASKKKDKKSETKN